MATSRAGVFLLPMAAFLALGIVRAIAPHGPPRAAAPRRIHRRAAADRDRRCLKHRSSSTGRMLTMLVFGVLIAIVGVEALWRRSSVAARAAGRRPADRHADSVHRVPGGLLRQLSGTVLDAIRSKRHARRGDHQSSISIAQEHAPLILLNDDGDNKSIRWRFYTLKHDREDLWARTRYFRVDEPQR